MLKEVRSRVRVGDDLGRRFWTTRGIKQRWASPVLLNIVMADLEEEMSKLGRDKTKERRGYIRCSTQTM